MEVAAIVSLITTFGPPAIDLVTKLIAKYETGGNVTSQEWATMTAELNVSAQDKMKAALAAAGIDPASAQGITLLSLAK